MSGSGSKPGRRRGMRRRRLAVDSKFRLRSHFESLEPRSLLASVQLSGIPSWTEEGPGAIHINAGADSDQYPFGGAVTSIAVHPFQPNTIFLGTVAGGVWRSLDAGVNWTPLTDQFPSLAIGAVSISTHDRNGVAVDNSTPSGDLVIYAGTGSFSSSGTGAVAVGVLRSDDGGDTWTLRTSAEMAGLPITGIAGTRDAGGHEVVLVSTRGKAATVRNALGENEGTLIRNGGLFRSTDGGETWTKKVLFTPPQAIRDGDVVEPPGSVMDMVADPGNSARFYAAVRGAGVFRSTDFGANWTKINSGLAVIDGVDNDGSRVADDAGETAEGAGRILLAVQNDATSATNAVYAALLGQPGSIHLMGVFRLTDGAASWQQLGSAAPTSSVAMSDTVAQGVLATPSNISFVDGQPDAIRRATGSWLADGFTDGDIVEVKGSLFNDSAYLAEHVTATDLQLKQTADVRAEGPKSGIKVSRRPRITLTVNAAGPDTITRADGDWGADGFAVGDVIRINGSPGNTKSYTVANVNTLVLTLAVADVLVAPAADLNGTGRIEVLRTPNITVTAGAATKITRSEGSWGDDGFQIGHQITLGGNSINAGRSFVVTAIADPTAANPERVMTVTAVGTAATGEGPKGGMTISGSAPATNAATTFTPQVNPGSQGELHFSIAADAAGNVFIGGDTRGGGAVFGNINWWNNTTNQWQAVVGANANSTAPHADSRAIVFNGTNLLEGDDGGIYRLTTPTTAARTWSSLNATLRATEIGSTNYDALNNVVFAGFQDNGNAEQPFPDNNVDDDGDGATDEADEKLFWRTIVTGNNIPGDGNNTGVIPIDTNNDNSFDQVLRYTGTNELDTFAVRRLNANGQVINADGSAGHDNLLLLRGSAADSRVVNSVSINTAASNANTLRIDGHNLNTGDGPFSINSSNNRVTRQYTNANDGFAGNFLTDDRESYFVVRVNANRIRLARTRADAMAATPVTVVLTGAGSGTITLTRRLNGLTDDDRRIFTSGFITPPFVVNAVDNTRMLLGLTTLYASANLTTGAGPAQYDRLDTVDRIFKPTRTPGNNFRFTAVAYGGMKSGTPQANVVYAARGNQIYIAFPDSSDNTKLGDFKEERIDGAVSVSDIVLDTDNYETAYAVAENGVYMRTAASGATAHPWVLISQRMNNPKPQTIEFTRQAGHGILLAGGANGVWRAIDPAKGVAWTKLGADMPNALVSDMHFVPRTPPNYVNPHALDRQDLLLVGTMGRGAWSVVDADSYLPTLGKIEITGTSAADTVVIERSAKNPSLMKVIVNGGAGPLGSTDIVPLRSVHEIVFEGGTGGADTLTIDSTNGAISVAGGIHFNGGSNDDTLVLKGKKVHNVDTDTTGSTTTVTIEDTRNGDTEVITVADTVTIDDSALDQASIFGKFGDALQRFFKWLAFWQDDPDPTAGAGTELALIRGTLPRALGGASPGGRDPVGDPDAPTGPDAPEEADAEGSDGENLGFLRLIEEGPNGFSLSDLSNLLDFDALAAKFDDLDDTPGNVTVLRDGSNVPFGIDAHVSRHLSGSASVNIEQNFVSLQGEVEIGADVDLHLVFGGDGPGNLNVFIDNDSSLTISNLQIDGDLHAEGNFGFLEVELEDAELNVDPSLALNVHLDPSRDKLRLGDFADALLNPAAVADLAQLDIVNAGGATNDLELSVDVGVAALVPGDDAPFELGEAHVSFTWNDITQPTNFNIAFQSAAAQKLQDFLDFAANGADQILNGLTTLQTQLNAVRDRGLDFRAPLLEASLDKLVDFVSAVDSNLIEPLSGGLSGSINVTSVQDMARLLARKAGLDPDDMGLNYDSGTGELTYHIHFDHAFNTGSSSLGLNLGDEDSGLAVVASVTGDLVPDLSLDFDLGVDIDGLLSSGSVTRNFFIRNASFSAGLELDVASLNAAARLGFLDISVVNGTAVANPHFTFELTDPGTDANDGRVDLKEIIDNLGNLSALLSSATASGSATIQLPISVNFGPINLPAGPDTTIRINIPDFSNPTDVRVTFPDVLKNAGIPDFNNLTAAKFVSLLGVLRDQMQRLSDTSFFADVNLPFVDGAISSALDFTSSITNGLLYDVGPDKTKDGPDRLAVDLNDALTAAGLASALVVQSDGTHLTLEVIDEWHLMHS